MEGYKIVFSATAGVKKIYPLIANNQPFFETTGIKSVFPNISSSNPFFETTGYKSVFPGIISGNPFFETTGYKTIFPVSQTLDTSKLLKLQFGDFTLASNYETIIASDNTGEYNSETNPGGYNPPLDAPDINRAKREEVDLYLVYRVWESSSAIPNTVFPSTYNPTVTPWEYTLAIESRGVYQMYMIAAPLGTDYSFMEGLGNSIYEFARNEPGWFATSAAVAIDDEIFNCVNKKRYQFLESIMCGDCNEDYLEVYGLLVGALNAFELGTDEAYIQGMTLIEKLKEICGKENCNCSC